MPSGESFYNWPMVNRGAVGPRDTRAGEQIFILEIALICDGFSMRARLRGLLASGCPFGRQFLAPNVE